MQVALSEDPAWFTPKAGSPAASRGRAADAAAAGTKELPIPSRRLSRMPARRLRPVDDQVSDPVARQRSTDLTAPDQEPKVLDNEGARQTRGSHHD